MGTRNLTAVFLEGKYRIAQYGQWDGYPEGQGATALAFLRSADLDAFKEKCKAAEFATPEQLKALGADWLRMHPQMSRDHGAKILEIVADAEPGILLRNQLDFAGDSLFCEFAYVIDFDAGTFEVFRGFNHDPLTDGRFIGMASPEGYYPVKLAASWPLADLPSMEAFLAHFQAEEEAE